MASRFPQSCSAWIALSLAALPLAAADPDVLATLRRGHPRLLLTDAQLAAHLAAASSDPLWAAVHAFVASTADAHAQEPPIEHKLVGPRLLDQSRKAIGHVLTSAMAFRLSGEPRFAAFARATMLRAAAFPDWNPSHFLDVAEMATALALGYDWLYDTLSPEDRATIKRALLDKALVFARPAYARADPSRESFPFVKGNLTNNWNQVCNGGFVLAALALAEEEPGLARLVLAGLRDTLPHAMRAYEPDGAYPEGPIYWGYGTRYTVYILAALETALGTDFGLGRLSAFDRTVLFRVHTTSPAGYSFNFADGRPNERLGGDEIITWLAQRHRHPFALAASRAWLAELLHEPPNPETARFVALHAAWFPPTDPAGIAPPLDARFSGPAQLALFRSAWGDSRALWAGFKAGSNTVNHAHLDLGSFVLEADGQRWAIDLGRDDYNLPGYWESADVTSRRWQYHRLNNHSHNTLTAGRALQPPAATAPIIRYESAPARACAIADLTPAYPGAARQIHRGLALLDRARVLVQDDVTALTPGTPLTWRMMTATRITLTQARAATLTSEGRTLRAEILSPATARFSVRTAKPPTTVENQNDGIASLEIDWPAAAAPADVRLAVLLTPVGDKWPALPAPALRPLDQW